MTSTGGRHVPGTPYNWEHGYIPLNAATAAKNRKGSKVVESLRKKEAAGKAPQDDAATSRSMDHAIRSAAGRAPAPEPKSKNKPGKVTQEFIDAAQRHGFSIHATHHEHEDRPASQMIKASKGDHSFQIITDNGGNKLSSVVHNQQGVTSKKETHRRLELAGRGLSHHEISEQLLEDKFGKIDHQGRRMEHDDKFGRGYRVVGPNGPETPWSSATVTRGRLDAYKRRIKPGSTQT